MRFSRTHHHSSVVDRAGRDHRSAQAADRCSLTGGRVEDSQPTQRMSRGLTGVVESRGKAEWSKRSGLSNMGRIRLDRSAIGHEEAFTVSNQPPADQGLSLVIEPNEHAA